MCLRKPGKNLWTAQLILGTPVRHVHTCWRWQSYFAVLPWDFLQCLQLILEIWKRLRIQWLQLTVQNRVVGCIELDVSCMRNRLCPSQPKKIANRRQRHWIGELISNIGHVQYVCRPREHRADSLSPGTVSDLFYWDIIFSVCPYNFLENAKLTSRAQSHAHQANTDEEMHQNKAADNDSSVGHELEQCAVEILTNDWFAAATKQPPATQCSIGEKVRWAFQTSYFSPQRSG